MGDSGLPFLLFALLVVVLPPAEVQTTFPLRSKNVCTSSGGRIIYTTTVHFYLECLGPAYQLQKAILNPLDTDALFITDFANCYGLAERSRELMTMIGNLQTGERLYIGAVVGYHF